MLVVAVTGLAVLCAELLGVAVGSEDAEIARDHWATEAHIRATGLTWTFLRMNLYMDFINLFMFLLQFLGNRE